MKLILYVYVKGNDHNKNSTARTRTHTCGSYIYIAGVEIFK